VTFERESEGAQIIRWKSVIVSGKLANVKVKSVLRVKGKVTLNPKAHFILWEASLL